MKARIKKTGEIAKIYGVDVRVGEYGSVTYYGADDVELIPDTPTTGSIDWEQRRFELVKAAMQVQTIVNPAFDYKDIAEWAIKQADAVLAEYKKGGEK